MKLKAKGNCSRKRHLNNTKRKQMSCVLQHPSSRSTVRPSGQLAFHHTICHSSPVLKKHFNFLLTFIVCLYAQHRQDVARVKVIPPPPQQYSLCYVHVSTGGCRVQGDPALVVWLVDAGSMLHQEGHHVNVVIYARLQRRRRGGQITILIK